jgi:hypothetical protein
MRLIGLAVVLTISVVLAPLAADAQQPKVYRIGVLSTGNPRSAAIYQALEKRLDELGYIEGQNLAIEFRNAEGKTDRLPRPRCRAGPPERGCHRSGHGSGDSCRQRSQRQDPHCHRERQL